MSKGLEIINIKLKDKDNKFDRQVVNGLGEILFIIKGTELETIEKELKALEIIKREFKPIIFEHDFGKYYLKLSKGNTMVIYEIETQEEYELLKEVLKHE